ncbi:hypothetical protein, variant [Aphanomyces astaci]|uniref:Sfi1 spindle body domain-containing protein n=1 Tax=Aphanomyces astaci TaxID=112090 RepID=W4FQY8_APHAT|nr:hypothetical protein, variant [Aphanomyces astaci]ETV69048.1 hypothetical protein, variant [Aphanomyces astaci]|eukprot:XP_009841507.1 hypothetical protein, variant [Aphanomyces astaci]
MPRDKHFYYAKYRDMLPEIKYYMRLKLTPLVYIHQHYLRHQLRRALARWTCNLQLNAMASHERELSTRLQKVAVWVLQSRVCGQVDAACRRLYRMHRFRVLATRFCRWKQHVTQYARIMEHAPAYLEWIVTTSQPAGQDRVHWKRLVRHHRARFRRWRQVTLGVERLRQRLWEWKERLRLYRWREWVHMKKQTHALSAQNKVELQFYRVRNCMRRWTLYRRQVHVQRVLARVTMIGWHRTTALRVFLRLQSHMHCYRKLRRAIQRFTSSCTRYGTSQVRKAWTVWLHATMSYKTTQTTITAVLRRMQLSSLRQGFYQLRSHCVEATYQAHVARVECAAGRVYGVKAIIRLWQLAILTRIRRAFHHLRSVTLHLKQDEVHRKHMVLWGTWVQWRRYHHSKALEQMEMIQDLKCREFEFRRQRLTHLGVPWGANMNLTRRTLHWLVTRHCFVTWKSQRYVQVTEGSMQRIWGHHSHRLLRQSTFQRWKHTTVVARKQVLVESGASMQKLLAAVTHQLQRHSDRHLCRRWFQTWRVSANQRRASCCVLQRVVATLHTGNLVRSFMHWKAWAERYAASCRLFAAALHSIQVGARWVLQSTTTCLLNVWRLWAAKARVRQQLAKQFQQLQDRYYQHEKHTLWQKWRQLFVSAAKNHETNRGLVCAMWQVWTSRLIDSKTQRRLLRRLTLSMYITRLRRALHRWTQHVLFQVTVIKTRHLQTRLAERDQQLRELLTDQATRCRQLEQLFAERQKMMQLLEESRQKLQQFKRLQAENQELKRGLEHGDRQDKLVEQLQGMETLWMGSVFETFRLGQCRLSDRLIGQVEAENERLRTDRERQEVASHVRLSELSMQLAEAREVCVRLKELEKYNQQLEERLQAQELAQKRSFLQHMGASKLPYEP